MPDPATFPAMRSLAENFVQGLSTFDSEVTADAYDQVATGYSEYAVANAKVSINKANALLKREGYMMCVAGTFSSGKSTFINALLGEPELLPAAAGECTLSITVVKAPGPSEPERVVIDYFTRDEAIANVVFHQKTYRNAFKHFEKDLDGAGADEMLAVIHKVIGWLPTVADDERLDEGLREEYSQARATEYTTQLKEFCEAVDTFAGRLGSSYVDPVVQNCAQYLTTDKDKKGLGHLFLISKVTIFRANPLFVEKGLQIIDTPGTDSPSPRQRQITHDYLENADVVVSVLEPRGFTMANMEIIETMARANLGNIRNKMFFVVNKFDTLDSNSYKKEALESLLKNDFHGRIVQNKLNPKHIYLTCALYDVEVAAGRDKDAADLLEYCKGRLASVSPDTDEPWKKKVTDCLTGQGIKVMREALLRYLEEELSFERLRDVRRYAHPAWDAVQALITANASQIAQAQTNRTTAIGRMREFILKTQGAFEVNLLTLAGGIPKVIENVIGQKLKPRAVEMVKRFELVSLADPAKQVAFTGAPAKLQTPQGIKQMWIDFTKQDFSNQFVELVCDTVVTPVQDLIDQQVKASNVDRILEHIGKMADTDLSSPLRGAIDQAKQNVEIITRLRADEETWPLRNREVHPQGFEAAWTPQIEAAFKQDLVTNYTAAFQTFCDKVAGSLGLYYKVIVERLITLFKERSDDLEKALMNTERLELPIHLLEDSEPDPAQARRARLLHYNDIYLQAAKADGDLEKGLA